MVKVLDNSTTARREPVSNGHSSETVAVPTQREAPETAEAALKVVRTLVEAGKVRLARERTTAFLEIWPDDARLQSAANVLAPPQVWSHKSERPRTTGEQEFKWIREHALEYSGQWVALLGDQLLASGRDFKLVRAELETIEGGSDALLHFQPSGPWVRS
jgi:hypothetical protein